jgi:hypothetical protein
MVCRSLKCWGGPAERNQAKREESEERRLAEEQRRKALDLRKSAPPTANQAKPALGDKVEITAGSLQGTTGKVIQVANSMWPYKVQFADGHDQWFPADYLLLQEQCAHPENEAHGLLESISDTMGQMATTSSWGVSKLMTLPAGLSVSGHEATTEEAKPHDKEAKPQHIHTEAMPNASGNEEFRKVVFKIGPIGMKINNASGRVSSVSRGGQAGLAGVTDKFQIKYVCGHIYTIDAFTKAFKSGKDYEVVFTRFSEAARQTFTFKPGPVGFKVRSRDNKVTQVDEQSQAHHAGVQVGMVIESVAGKLFSGEILQEHAQGWRSYDVVMREGEIESPIAKMFDTAISLFDGTEAAFKSCSSRLPVRGDLVQHKDRKVALKDRDGNIGAWKLEHGEVAEVVEVDKDGDFRLRSPAGVVSGFAIAKDFVYLDQALAKPNLKKLERSGSWHYSSAGTRIHGVLSVRIISAYNLKNTDSGLLGDVSDPYAVVKLGKRSFRTEVIQNNLNPVWNTDPFSFNVDSNNGDDRELLVEVFDHNNFHSDACLGHVHLEIATLKLLHWQYCNVREHLVDGDKGEIEFEILFCPAQKLEAAASDSVEALEEAIPEDLDQRTEKNGMLSVRLVAAHNLRDAGSHTLGDISDPFAVARIGKQKGETLHIRNNLNPVWDAQSSTFPFIVDTTNAELRSLEVEVFDWNILQSHESLGKVVMDMQSLSLKPWYPKMLKKALANTPGAKGDIWFELIWCPPETQGQIDLRRKRLQMRIEEVRKKAEEERLMREQQAREKAEAEARLKAQEEARKKAEQVRLKAENEYLKDHRINGILSLRIVAAYNLKNTDSGVMGDVSDPFATAKIGKQKYETKKIDNELNPKWNDKPFPFNLDTMQLDQRVLQVEVLDHNNFHSNTSLGTLEIDLMRLEHEPFRVYKMRKELVNGDKGEIEFELLFCPAEQAHEVLSVRMIAGYNLKNVDIWPDLSDPFVIARVGKQKFETKRIDNSLNPLWDAAPFAFNMATVKEDERTLKVDVLDHNNIRKNKPMGSLEIDVPKLKLVPYQARQLKAKLTDGDDGVIEFDVVLCPCPPQKSQDSPQRKAERSAQSSPEKSSSRSPEKKRNSTKRPDAKEKEFALSALNLNKEISKLSHDELATEMSGWSQTSRDRLSSLLQD